MFCDTELTKFPERWKKAVKDFYPGNLLRAALFGGAYVAGLFGLASSRVL